VRVVAGVLIVAARFVPDAGLREAVALSLDAARAGEPWREMGGAQVWGFAALLDRVEW
jgi:hypothetical protein